MTKSPSSEERSIAFDLTAEAILRHLNDASKADRDFDAFTQWSILGPDPDIHNPNVRIKMAKKCLEMLFFDIIHEFFHPFEYVSGTLTENQKRSKFENLKNAHDDLNPTAKRLVEAYANPISTTIVSRLYRQNYLFRFEEIRAFLRKEKGIYDSSLLDRIVSKVYINLRIHLKEIEGLLSGELNKRGAYRKRENRQHPDLPSNHYKNLKTKPIGVRSTDKVRNAVDEAIIRDGGKLSRNAWVNAAIEEKLQREYPDLLKDSNMDESQNASTGPRQQKPGP